MKKALFMICITGFFVTFSSVSSVCAFEAEDFASIMPQSDLDFIVLQNSQTKTVTADLSFPMDFGIVPVTLIGFGNFTASLTRRDTRGELVYMYLSVIKGFGRPSYDLKVGLTPFTSLNSLLTISDDDEFNWAEVLIIHGILFSLEDPPYEYSLTLKFQDKPV